MDVETLKFALKLVQDNHSSKTRKILKEEITKLEMNNIPTIACEEHGQCPSLDGKTTLCHQATPKEDIWIGNRKKIIDESIREANEEQRKMMSPEPAKCKLCDKEMPYGTCSCKYGKGLRLEPQDKEKEAICPDCLAHNIGEAHVCDTLMKMLVDNSKSKPKLDWEEEFEALIMHYKESRASDDDLISFIRNLLSKQKDKLIEEVEEKVAIHTHNSIPSYIDDLDEGCSICLKNKCFLDVIELIKKI